MTELLPLILPIIALAVSCFGLSLNFFGRRNRLTAVITSFSRDQQVSRSYDGEVHSAFYRCWINPDLVFSNRGNQTLVLVDVTLVSLKKKQENGEGGWKQSNCMKPFILEAGSINYLPFTFELPYVKVETSTNEEIKISNTSDSYNMEFTIIDGRGHSHVKTSNEPIIVSIEYMSADKKDVYTPDREISFKYEKSPITLLKRGILA